MRNTLFFTFLGLTMAVAVLLFGGVSLVKANPAFYGRVQSATATTTYSRIALGVGTTTLVYNGGNKSIDGGVLQLQIVASTTNPIVAVRVEHSYDCVDYYPEMITNTTASTTKPGLFIENQLAFGSSTAATTGFIGSSAGGNAGTYFAHIPVTLPTKCTRAIIYGVSGSGSLYAELIPRQQVQ